MLVSVFDTVDFLEESTNYDEYVMLFENDIISEAMCEFIEDSCKLEISTIAEQLKSFITLYHNNNLNESAVLLNEASFKDMWERLKELIRRLWEKIKSFFTKKQKVLSSLPKSIESKRDVLDELKKHNFKKKYNLPVSRSNIAFFVKKPISDHLNEIKKMMVYAEKTMDDLEMKISMGMTNVLNKKNSENETGAASPQLL